MQAHPVTSLTSRFHGVFFSQHKEKTKDIDREVCTERTRSTHKHGGPEVSYSHRVGSFPVALCQHLLSWLFIRSV